MGDGESDEPESLSQLSLAGREGLDNIVMTMNCNLQRLDGPVRGNSKIVQELEGRFRGAGWNVIKVLWGSSWDDLFARDTQGLLAARLNGLVDGDEQRIMTADGATIRKELFNSDGLAALVAHLSDDDLEALCADVGGHDFTKLHAAYAAATAHKGQPTAVLIRTIKGYGLGCLRWPEHHASEEEGRHGDDAVHAHRFGAHVYRQGPRSLSLRHARGRSRPRGLCQTAPCTLGGSMPKPVVPSEAIELAEAKAYAEFDEGTKGTMGLHHDGLCPRASGLSLRVPIIPDEAFGMDPLFAEFGIYHPEGQLFDHNVLMKYKESAKGQLFEERSTRLVFIASATSYSTGPSTRCSGSMADLSKPTSPWFPHGRHSGRTTLNGEGLQHQDGPRLKPRLCLRVGDHHPPRYRRDVR